MAKGNIFQGTGRGKLGDVVLYRKGGEQISRIRVHSISNPRTEAQLINRVFTSTNSKAYAALRSIVDHSFQQYTGKQANMQRFLSVNYSMLRGRVHRSAFGNVNPKGEARMAIMPWVVSEGDLQPLKNQLKSAGGTTTHCVGENITPGMSYAEVCVALGIPAGAQITIMQASQEGTDGFVDAINVARIIMAPASGDMTLPFIDAEAGAVNDPNESNDGAIESITIDGGSIVVALPIYGRTLVLGTAIVSTYEGGTWRRSNQKFVATSANNADPIFKRATLGDAVASYENAVQSSLYLNQADIEASNGAAEGLKKYTITLNANDDTLGSVSGGGQFEEGTEVTIRATPKGEAEFLQWSDGDTNATRTLIVTTNITLTAEFDSMSHD